MYNNKTGKYKIINPEKFVKPIDNHMKSFNESTGEVIFKSNLELKAFRYCDANKHIVKWSVEPFHVKYLKPTSDKTKRKIHRYFIDIFIEFDTKHKFIVEIKSKGETIRPKIPRKKTPKALRNYQKAQMTYAVNQAKWEAAKAFAQSKGMRFIILTEEQLGR